MFYIVCKFITYYCSYTSSYYFCLSTLTFVFAIIPSTKKDNVENFKDHLNLSEN